MSRTSVCDTQRNDALAGIDASTAVSERKRKMSGVPYRFEDFASPIESDGRDRIRVEHLEEQLSQTETQIGFAKERIAFLENMLSKSTEKIKDLEKRNAQLTQEIKESKNDNSQLSQKVEALQKNLESRVASCVSPVAQVELEDISVASENEEFDSSRVERAQETLDLRKALYDTKMQMNEVKTAYDELFESHSALKERLEQEMDKNKLITTELAELKYNNFGNEENIAVAADIYLTGTDAIKSTKIKIPLSQRVFQDQ